MSDEAKPLRTFKLTVAYNGSRYSGWQWQPGETLSVQRQIETAIHQIIGEEVRVAGSGRTDAGVHAFGQVASFSTNRWNAPADRWVRAFNCFLPKDIVVRRAEEAALRFHAIRDSVGKLYRYTIRNSRVVDPHLAHLQWCVHRTLDVEAMRAAAQRLVGTHDFASLQGQGSPRYNTVRTIHTLEIQATDVWEGRVIEINVCANGFLYNMVRNIVGTLVEVGHGKHPPEWIDELLAKRDRSSAGQTAPAAGLCLMEVLY
ncbi:MAG: tRNA pseudouridine(38-40) synthase TruA [Planctomycetaceae bacterium]|nr:tRNA pseudouridine(38-40) synthase TruA [Planctomycetaceae bacterium]MBN8600928.1 tRNA pseudouridine(38-40) synthase TruA [Planctomycetota bacterium]